MGRMNKGRKLTAILMLAILMAGIVSTGFASMLTSNPVTISVPIYQVRWYIKNAEGAWIGLHDIEGGVSGFSLEDTLFPSGATIQRSDIPPYPATGDGNTALHETETNGHFTGRWLADTTTPVTVGTRVTSDLNIYAEYNQETRRTYAITVSDKTDYGTLPAAYHGSLDYPADAVPEYSDYRLWWTYPHNEENAERNEDYAIDWVSINGTRIANYPKESAYLDLSNISEDTHIEFAFRQMDPGLKVAFSASQAESGSTALGTVTPSGGYVEVGGDVQFHFDLFYSSDQKNEIAKIMVNGVRVSDFERGAWDYTVRNVQEPFTLTYTIMPVMAKTTITVVPAATYNEGGDTPSYSFTFSGEKPEDTQTVRDILRDAFDTRALTYSTTVDSYSSEGEEGTVSIEGTVTALDSEYFLFFDTGTVVVGPKQATPPTAEDTTEEDTTEEETTEETTTEEETTGDTSETTENTTDRSTELGEGPPLEETGHRVEIRTDGNGVVTSPALTDGVTMVADNAPLHITYTPNEGYEFDSLKVDYSGLWIPLTDENVDVGYSVASVTGPISLLVSFKEKVVAAPKLKLGAVYGTITEPANEEVDLAKGAPLTVRFRPDEGYVFQAAEIREKDGTWTKLENITAEGGVIEGLGVDGEFRVLFTPDVGGTGGEGHTVSLRAVGGTVTSPAGGTASFVPGSTLPVTYQAAEGNTFRMAQIRSEGGEWQDVPGATATGCVLTGLTADTELCVTFTSPTQYIVRAEATEGGSIIEPAMPDGYALVNAGESLTIGYTAVANAVVQKIETKVEDGDWTSAEIGATPGRFTLENINANTTVRITFMESQTGKKVIVVTPVIDYMYGDSEPTVGFGISGFYDVADEDSIYEKLNEGLRNGSITVALSVDSRTAAGTEGSATLTGSSTMLGDAYEVGFGSSTFTVSRRPIYIKAKDQAVILGQTYELAAQLGAYNNVGGPLEREGEALVYNVVVRDNATASEVGTYDLDVVVDKEASPNYDIYADGGELKLLGKVTYKTNYPESSGLEDTTFTDPIDYERDAVVTTPAVGNTGFNTTGLTFKGWILNDKVYNAGTKFKMGARHVEISASWEKTQYALTVLHYVEDSTKAVASPDTYLYESGETYTVLAKQVTGYKPKEASKTGVMPANDLTITIYYTASGSSGGGDDTSGGATDTSGGGTGNTGGGTGGSIATEAPITTSDTDSGGVNVDFEASNTGDTDTGDTDSTEDGGGGGSGGHVEEGSEDPYETEPESGSRATPNYTIQENDIPLGGVAARNVGDCFE